MEYNKNPIGVFDSGVGGVSVLSELISVMPNEDFLYFGDSYNAPYGTKSNDEILKLSQACTKKLLDMGAKNVILTGVTFEEDKLGAAYMGQDRKAEYYFQPRLPGTYHGTGDVFASSFCGAVLNGFSLYDSMGIAVRYVCDCIKRTQSMDTPITYGVDFERGIPYYIKELGKI